MRLCDVQTKNLRKHCTELFLPVFTLLGLAELNLFLHSLNHFSSLKEGLYMILNISIEFCQAVSRSEAILAFQEIYYLLVCESIKEHRIKV